MGYKLLHMPDADLGTGDTEVNQAKTPALTGPTYVLLEEAA